MTANLHVAGKFLGWSCTKCFLVTLNQDGNPLWTKSELGKIKEIFFLKYMYCKLNLIESNWHMYSDWMFFPSKFWLFSLGLFNSIFVISVPLTSGLIRGVVLVGGALLEGWPWWEEPYKRGTTVILQCTCIFFNIFFIF